MMDLESDFSKLLPKDKATNVKNSVRQEGPTLLARIFAGFCSVSHSHLQPGMQHKISNTRYATLKLRHQIECTYTYLNPSLSRYHVPPGNINFRQRQQGVTLMARILASFCSVSHFHI